MTGQDPLDTAAEQIRAASVVALACHVGPDGDALGSMLGFGLAARAAGKSVVASFGSPYQVPNSLRFLAGLDLLVPPADFPPAPDLMVVFDAGSKDRLGELASNASAANAVIVVDHHVTNEGFGDIQIVDGGVAATGHLVFDLLGRLGWEITPEIAQNLLTAIVTDTGRFQYSNTTAETLQVGSALVALGADTSTISRHVYEEAPFGYLLAAGRALSRARLNVDRSIVATVITQADLAEAGVGWTDTDNLIDTLRLAEEADVAVLAKHHEDGRVKVSMRSRGATDVGSLAASFGGGGHRLAAGFTVEADPDQLIEEIVAMVEAYR